MTDPLELQADKFPELARDLACDEGGAALQQQVRRVAKVPPPEDEQKAGE